MTNFYELVHFYESVEQIHKSVPTVQMNNSYERAGLNESIEQIHKLP